MTDAPLPRKSLLYRALDAIERIGDKLPDPVFMFAWMIAALVVASTICAGLGVAAVNPVNGETLAAKSLLAPDNVRTLLTDMPKTLTGFAPLGYVLLIMLGAGVAEGSGLLSAAIRALMRVTPRALVTPAVIGLGLLSNQAADSGFVILVPLAGMIFASVGRHPIVGIGAAFAGVAGSFAGNPLPGQFDALLMGITEPAARLLVDDWRANLAGNWYFTATTGLIFAAACWFVTDRIVEPRLGPWRPTASEVAAEVPLTARERNGLAAAGLAALCVAGLWAALALAPGAPLVDREAEGPLRWTPFLRSLIAGFFVLFLMTGIAYGRVAGTIRSDRDVVRMAAEAMRTMAPYIVLVFAAAHFIAMFNWSNLGAIIAIEGAESLRASGLPIPGLLVALVLMTAALDLFIGSGSAKWAALAPVLVPMLLLLGVSPEMTTAAYRMGDAAVNMTSPLMPYFPLVLGFCQRWKPDFGVGGLLTITLTYATVMLACGLVMTGAWAMFELSTGPGAPMHYSPPEPVPAPITR